MAKVSQNKFPKATFAEKANDGSETPTPSAGHHNLFVGEDGAVRLKDESGAVTPLAGSFTGDASDVPYTPAEAADWATPPPDDVAEALDELAARESGSGNGGPGGGTGWELVDSWTHSSDVANVDFTDLSDYNEIMVVIRNITLTTNGFRLLLVSTNNGASYFNGSGDYIEINDSGAETARFDLTLQNQSTNNARSGVIHIPNFNQSDSFKICNQITNGNNNHMRLFVASTDPLNAVRVTASGTAELTGGSIFVFGR